MRNRNNSQDYIYVFAGITLLMFIVAGIIGAIVLTDMIERYTNQPYTLPKAEWQCSQKTLTGECYQYTKNKENINK